jgi:hypothetical protein
MTGPIRSDKPIRSQQPIRSQKGLSMPVRVVAVGRTDVPPLPMSDRIRHEVTYFLTAPGKHGVPELPEREYWVRLVDSERALDEGCLRLVSPLDSDSTAEIEITEEQEAWLGWMVKHRVEHIRLEQN